ncbi:hypothetical protein J6S37_00525 [Candidatus Saccharibacteria bacterium]|nr:hypothetical protein [Candidatus Saccharibacteria bacterium]
MKRKGIKLIVAILTVVLGGLSLATPTFASKCTGVEAGTQDYIDKECDNPCNVLEENNPAFEALGCGKNNDETKTQFSGLIINILNGIIAVSGLIAVIYVVIGGVNYMTSAGDSGKTQKARNTILYALIGLVVCVLAFAIVNFVIRKIIG